MSSGTVTTPATGPADRVLDPGQHAGEYVIESMIGAGGFGTVYRARHPLIGKLAAVKVLSRQFSVDPEMVSRFVDEARAVNQIRHRNIIDIFSFGQLDDERSYYVMELLDGQPLDEVIAERGACSLADSIPILRGIARALDAAHGSGVAHRDLKPENVFLARESDGSSFPKLLDFGIAKLIGDRAAEQQHKTRTGAPIGTPYYMSPEQCRGQGVDHRTDIYAFGCMAYKMLTGVVPFDGDVHLDVLMRQITDEPVPPSERVTGLPLAVDDVIAWMMRKDPAERPPDLVTAVHALENAARAAGVELVADSASRTPATHTPVPPRPSAPSMTPPPATTPRRSRLAIGIAVVGAAVGGAVIAVMLMTSDGGRRAPAEPPPAPAAPIAAPSAAGVAPSSSVVTITITGSPAGTEVYGPAGPLGTAPGTVQVVRGPDEVQLVFKAEGYETAIARLTPDGDQSIDVPMTAKAVATTPPPASPPNPPPTKKPTKPVRPRPGPTSKPIVEVKVPTRPVTDPFGRK
ncbi:MAG TPA: serine/threonine-protein kinase [Kofleriaceae bacterium]|nr:serine/threonine-protein kinase [Kofleriaceae bacterium]